MSHDLRIFYIDLLLCKIQIANVSICKTFNLYFNLLITKLVSKGPCGQVPPTLQTKGPQECLPILTMCFWGKYNSVDYKRIVMLGMGGWYWTLIWVLHFTDLAKCDQCSINLNKWTETQHDGLSKWISTKSNKYLYIYI